MGINSTDDFATYSTLFRSCWVIGLEISVAPQAGAAGPFENGSSHPVVEYGSFFDSAYPVVIPTDITEAKDYKLTLPTFRPLVIRFPVH